MADETKQVSVIMGPYRGNRLTMPTAEADQAVNDHWAVDPYVENPEPYPGHPPLSDEEREHAVEAATAWAHTQWGVDDPELEPLSADETAEQRQQREQRNQERREQRRRDMQAGQPGAYTTRQAQRPRQPPQPDQPPTPPSAPTRRAPSER